jgi:LDH2 family malate/lactate/ureidoglycolate dehydrogenase
VETLLATIRDQDGARVPGDRRKANRVKTESAGVSVNPAQQAALGL